MRDEKALPLVYQQQYGEFQQRLAEMSRSIDPFDQNAPTLQSEITKVQNFFREHILTLPMAELTPSLQHWVQSYQVECDKQLRLLGVDAMRLQAARQTATIEQRLQQVRDRLDTLQRYCTAVLEKREA
ncbi:MAG: heterocyst frequency control protein PatD [Leptolyngbya sp. BL-A-14]